MIGASTASGVSYALVQDSALRSARRMIRGEKSLVTRTRPLVWKDAAPLYGVQLKELMIVVKTADSAFLSNAGGGVG